MGLNIKGLSGIKTEELLNGISSKSDMIIELLQGIQNPETATFTIQGFHKTVDINGEQTIEAPEGRYFSKIISINNSASDNSTVKFNKALGGYDIPEGTSKLIKGLNDINMNCQVHSITINSGTASSYTVVAETKPYRYEETTYTLSVSDMNVSFNKGDTIITPNLEVHLQDEYGSEILYIEKTPYTFEENIDVGFLAIYDQTGEQVEMTISRKEYYL